MLKRIPVWRRYAAFIHLPPVLSTPTPTPAATPRIAADGLPRTLEAVMMSSCFSWRCRHRAAARRFSPLLCFAPRRRRPAARVEAEMPQGRRRPPRPQIAAHFRRLSTSRRRPAFRRPPRRRRHARRTFSFIRRGRRFSPRYHRRPSSSDAPSSRPAPSSFRGCLARAASRRPLMMPPSCFLRHEFVATIFFSDYFLLRFIIFQPPSFAAATPLFHRAA